MALKDLSTRTMVELGAELVREGSPQRRAIEAVPQAAVLLPDIEGAQSGIIAAQPPSKTELDKITQRLARADGRHDDVVRAIDDRLLSEQSATEDPEVRERIGEVRRAVLVTGRSIVNRTFLDEAGEGELRAGRVTAEHRAVLRKLETYEGTTYEALYDELQALAAEIGRLERQRSDTSAARERLENNREARHRWIRVINALATMLELAGVDEEPILRHVREAEAEAALRVGPADEDEGEGEGGGEDVGPDSDTDATDVLDPPAPAGDDEPREPTR